MISVVIITRNEAGNIVDCIRSAKLVSNDIIVVDCGSTDETIILAGREGARTLIIPWISYGYSRNAGAGIAENDWVLSLDADERITKELATSILKNNFRIDTIYSFKRQNFLGDKKISFGTFGCERKNRIYNRYVAEWDLTLIHEQLISSCTARAIKGKILHYGLKDCKNYHYKVMRYSVYGAKKLFCSGRRTSFLKKYTSAIFNSAKSYLLKLGFLDGYTGWVIAKGVAKQSFLKYKLLERLHERNEVMDEQMELNPAVG